ncbi:uncharacterized protein EDB91DRAFT_213246 [Suillus paluster]|uniref:uncharacterized protein n=1 Tax=Suillus paluster TaxID=48578 RepID=UPI001B878615|nr:uncharacterized protein EDB91DRAFT_213246 [Suillus paluster]KAG1744165.1 hypothetical protein EDB91DRAFT_213246 [Suillus paluster]
MMHSSILSLICTFCILISCAARVVVRDTAPDMAVSDDYISMSGALWAPSIHDKIIPNKGKKSSLITHCLNLPLTVRTVGRYAPEARSTPVDKALWESNLHEKSSPSRARAVDRRENGPQETPVSGLLWEGAVHEALAARQPVRRKPADASVGGFLFQSAVHQHISDS